MFHGKLVIDDFIAKHSMVSCCSLCVRKMETLDHLSTKCYFVVALASFFSVSLDLSIGVHNLFIKKPFKLKFSSKLWTR